MDYETIFKDGNESCKLKAVGAAKSDRAILTSIALTSVPILLSLIIRLKIPTISIELIVFMASIGFFLTALFQWSEARKEITLDKYFDRRDLVNSRLDEWPHARKMVRHFWGSSGNDNVYQKIMYVYCELDNLEYILEKHKIGYVSPIHAWRGVETFISRCFSSEFREIAKESIIGSGYTSYTKGVVLNILQICEKKWEK